MAEETRITYRTRMTLLQKMQTQYDEKAWQEFVEIYSGFIYSVIHKMNIRECDVDDLRQDIFLKLWKKLPEIDLDKMDRFRGYLKITIRNSVIDFMKRKTREAKRYEKMDFPVERIGDEAISAPEIDKVVEKEWIKYISALAFKNIANFFSADAIKLFREILNGRDVKTVADEMGVGLSTAYRQNSRIKASLLAEIEALNGNEGK